MPPKNHSSDQPGEKAIRQLLGRSPDRADSLALAVWALDRWKRCPDFSDYDLACEDDSELTPEEIAAMPEELREICEMEDDLQREYRARRWDDADW